MKTSRLTGLIAILALMLVFLSSSTSLMINTVHATDLPPQLAAADLDNSGNVTLADITGFALIYGWNSTNPGWNSPILPGWRNASEADFTGNGIIGIGDLVTLAYAYALNSTV